MDSLIQKLQKKKKQMTRNASLSLNDKIKYLLIT